MKGNSSYGTGLGGLLRAGLKRELTEPTPRVKVKHYQYMRPRASKYSDELYLKVRREYEIERLTFKAIAERNSITPRAVKTINSYLNKPHLVPK